MKTAVIKNNRVRSIYDPELDKFSGSIIFKEKFESAKKLLANTTIPKEILDKINREFDK
jgi:hypothetical protein